VNKIYTKAGDAGHTSTLGRKMSKGDKLAEVLGSIDELNSIIGICRKEYKRSDKELKTMQTNLMTIASVVAGGKKYDLGDLDHETERLEKLIDMMTEKLPKLQNFIYPTGYLQMARAVARRAEREVVKMKNENYKIYDAKDEERILRYMNRLSDGLFMMARIENRRTRTTEEVWRK
jgi:cob(I)alamin adenosyltransferase